MHFAYLDLTTIDELSNEMKSPHNVFALLVIPWLLGLRNSSTVVTVEIQRARGIREHNKLNKELIQTPYFAASEAAMYSASIVESTNVSCLELFQLTAPPFTLNTKPD